jgi:hypothetical protein
MTKNGLVQQITALEEIHYREWANNRFRRAFVMALKFLLHPGDTKGKPSQAINRIFIALEGKRDENGMLIRKKLRYMDIKKNTKQVCS